MGEGGSHFTFTLVMVVGGVSSPNFPKNYCRKPLSEASIVANPSVATRLSQSRATTISHATTKTTAKMLAIDLTSIAKASSISTMSSLKGARSQSQVYAFNQQFTLSAKLASLCLLLKPRPSSPRMPSSGGHGSLPVALTPSTPLPILGSHQMIVRC